ADGAKPSVKTSSKPVACRKCNKEIPSGMPFYEVDHAPKCRECCIADNFKPAAQTSSRPVPCKKCHKDIPAGTPFY
ncbi:hypothetical protein GCK32_019038, partial [Trichostrongylus colubriformis]